LGNLDTKDVEMTAFDLRLFDLFDLALMSLILISLKSNA